MKERHSNKLSDIHLGGLFRLVSLTFGLYWYTEPMPPPDLCPLSLCSDGGVGERAGRIAEDARPGKPQLLHAGEEDLCVEAPAADTATRSGETDGLTLSVFYFEI